MSPREETAACALAELMATYCACRITAADMRAVSIGASGRCIMRAEGVAAAQDIIGIYWTNERADNFSFLPCAKGLAKAGLNVPRILAEANYGQDRAACLVQDLGSRDILSLKQEPWSMRKEAYQLAMQSLAPLYRLEPGWDLQPPFDTTLYRWEQSYFARHLIGRHLGGDAAAFLAQPALQEMAEWLAGLPLVPVHRDCQSQNIMLAGGKAWLIDFQGMRMGRGEYDLASLLCDPYMELSPEGQDELLLYWQQLTGKPIDPAIYCACALQRLMQALGAFANIGYNQHRDWYLNMIPTGLKSLHRIAALCPEGSLAQRAAACLPNVP